MNNAAAIRADRLRRWAAYASLSLSVVMLIAKSAAWLLTGSVALLTALADASVDLVGSLATLVAIHYARRPADPSHRFGHGKAESLAALLQAVFLAGAAVALIGEAVERFIVPHPLAQLNLGIQVIAVSLIATLIMIGFESYALKHGDSQAIAASRAHYVTDVIISAAVLAALALTKAFRWNGFDPVFAIGVAIFIIVSAWRIAAGALAIVLDRELPGADRQRIKETVLRQEQVKGLHDLRTRDAGDRIFVEFHLELDPHISVQDGHSIADRVERAVRAEFPLSEILVHQEPEDLVDDRLDDRLGS